MAVLKITIPARTEPRVNGTDPLQRPVLISVAGHVVLIVAAVWGAVAGRHSLIWGDSTGGGAAASVNLVSAASIPLPPPSVDTNNKVASDEPGLHYSEVTPKPVPKPLPEKAIELPGRNAKPAPKKPVRDPQLEARIHKLEKQLLSPPNAIPNGAGGPVKGPYGNFQNDAGTGGFAFSPNAGDFGTRYGWYVTAIRSRISSNWLKGTVDPTVQVAPRVYVVFEINRDGQLVNAQVTQPSGIASLDRSALRAVLDSNPMPALPADYRGSSVAVEFWFEFRR